jgi:hypothetical protein
MPGAVCTLIGQPMGPSEATPVLLAWETELARE